MINWRMQVRFNKKGNRACDNGKNNSDQNMYASMARMSYNDLVLKHHSEIHLPLLLNMCCRGTLLACFNYSKLLPILFFIIYPQYLFSLREYALAHPHR